MFTPNADTYVNSATPAANYGTATTIRADGSPDVHAYLRFTVQGLGTRPITHARLLIFANSATTSGISAKAVADNTWGELTTTYNNFPALGSTLASSGAVTTGTWVTLDVSSYVTAQGTYSFGIITPGATAISMASRESGANAPQLVLDLGAGAASLPSLGMAASLPGFEPAPEETPAASPLTPTPPSEALPPSSPTITLGAPDAAPALDSIPPSGVRITAPTNGSAVTGRVRVNSAAGDNVRVVSVSFYMDGRRIARDAQAPFSILWDTAKVAKGPHTLYVIALDAAGNATRSALIALTVR